MLRVPAAVPNRTPLPMIQRYCLRYDRTRVDGPTCRGDTRASARRRLRVVRRLREPLERDSPGAEIRCGVSSRSHPRG